jgi:hypothetical protein
MKYLKLSAVGVESLFFFSNWSLTGMRAKNDIGSVMSGLSTAPPKPDPEPEPDPHPTPPKPPER